MSIGFFLGKTQTSVREVWLTQTGVKKDQHGRVFGKYVSMDKYLEGIIGCFVQGTESGL